MGLKKVSKTKQLDISVLVTQGGNSLKSISGMSFFLIVPVNHEL